MRWWLVISAAALTIAANSEAFAAEPPQTYVVPACTSALGPHSLAGWTTSDSSVGAFDRCAIGGGFGATLSRGFVTWRFRAPADIEIVGLRLWRFGQLPPEADYFLSVWTNDALGVRTLEWSEDLRQSPAGELEFTGIRGYLFEMRLGCSTCDLVPASVAVSRLEMVAHDVANPRVVGATGSAFSPVTVSGTVTTKVDYADVGGGVRDVALIVDGARQSVSEAQCSKPYVSVTPCPIVGATAFAIDTRSLSDGEHTVAFEVSDVAGNRSTSKTYEINVRNTLVASPAPSPALKLALARAKVAAAFDATPVIRATVRDLAGAPVAGVKVGVAVRKAMSTAGFVLDTPVFSDANGDVTVKLAKGPSREVRLTAGDQTALVKITVKAPLRLKITPRAIRNGGSIKFRGTVSGAQEDTKVELQAKSGRKWIPFKTVTLRGGRFGARYRFTRTFARTRYTFRAVIHRDPRFPYAPATSKVASVVVRPY
jgi:hypothetical protein